LPITPFHFGPGALIKVVMPDRFSWMVFALSNILIDMEPIGLFLLTGDPAHPWLHTLPGAIIVAATAATLGRKPCEKILYYWNSRLSGWEIRWLAVSPGISATAAWTGALIGTLSHIALDSVMHTDVEALWPIKAGNTVQGLIPLDALHWACVVSAVVALGTWLLKQRRLRQ